MNTEVEQLSRGINILNIIRTAFVFFLHAAERTCARNWRRAATEESWKLGRDTGWWEFQEGECKPRDDV